MSVANVFEANTGQSITRVVIEYYNPASAPCIGYVVHVSLLDTEVTGGAIPREIQARKATSIIMRW
jgi:hypothetical protein